MAAPKSPLPTKLWDEMFQRHIRQLNKSRSRGKVKADQLQIEFAEFEARTAQIIDSARTSKTAKLFQTMLPGFNQVRVFADAISSFAQVQPQPLCLIWGCIQLVLAGTVHFVSTLDLIVEMFEELSRYLAVLNRYVHLLPKNMQLLKYLYLIYDNYIGFCVTTANALQKCTWYTPLKWSLVPIKSKFQFFRDNVGKHVEAFMSEANVSVAESLVHGLSRISSGADIVQSSGPQQKGQSFVCNVPFSRNPFFVGREVELSTLFKHLSPGSSSRASPATRASVIHSMGGMGKTQLALEFTYRYRSCFDYCFWLSAERGPALAQSFIRLLDLIYDDTDSDASVLASGQAVQRVKTWLERTESCWLVVFDNFEDWNTVQPFWPCTGNGSILVTTQHPEISQFSGGMEVKLPPLGCKDGGRLLLKHLRRLDEKISTTDVPIAESISEAVGGLPMAISHVAGYMDKSKSSLEEFNAMYQRRDQTRRVWRQNCRAWTYQYSGALDSLWDIALKELSDEATLLIYQLAMLSPDHIAEDLLLQSKGGKYSNDQLQDLLISLRDRQLVDREVLLTRPFWSIHRALQINLLLRLDEDVPLRQRVFEDALRLVRAQFPRQSDIQAPSNDNWEANETNLPHALHLQATYQQSIPPVEPVPEFAELLGDVGNYCWERAFYDQGVETLELAEKIYECHPSWDLLQHSKVSTLLGVLSQEIGITGRKRGLDRCVKSLALRKQHVANLRAENSELSESEWLLLANAWNDVACSLLELSSYAQAEEFLEQSIEIKRTHNLAEEGRAYFNFAENFKNLALVRIAQSRHDAAVDLTTRAVHLMEVGEGPLSASTQAFRFHKAYAHFYKGDLLQAWTQHEEVRESRERIFGLNEVHTLNSYYACSLMCFNIGRLAESRKLLEICLTGGAKWTKEGVCRARFLLSCVMAQQIGAADDARAMGESASQMMRDIESRDVLLPMEPPRSELDEDISYDRLVSFEAGRSTIGRYDIHGVPVGAAGGGLPPPPTLPPSRDGVVASQTESSPMEGFKNS